MLHGCFFFVLWNCSTEDSAARLFLKISFFYDPRIESTTSFFLPLVPRWSQQTVWVSPEVICSGSSLWVTHGLLKVYETLISFSFSIYCLWIKIPAIADCLLPALLWLFFFFLLVLMKSNSNIFLREEIYKVVVVWTNLCVADFSIIL